MLMLPLVLFFFCENVVLIINLGMKIRNVMLIDGILIELYFLGLFLCIWGWMMAHNDMGWGAVIGVVSRVVSGFLRSMMVVDCR